MGPGPVEAVSSKQLLVDIAPRRESGRPECEQISKNWQPFTVLRGQKRSRYLMAPSF